MLLPPILADLLSAHPAARQAAYACLAATLVLYALRRLVRNTAGHPTLTPVALPPHNPQTTKACTAPRAPGGVPYVGHVAEMLRSTPWDLMTAWTVEKGPLVKFTLFGRECLVVAEPEALRQIMNTRMSNFKKDLGFTYAPFLCLLGTGLVTSDGAFWRKQRSLVSAAFRIEILDDIPAISKKAAERFAAKVAAAGPGAAFDMIEEMRHLTLHVVGDAILSITPDESDRTFARMYLPIVTEGNKRTFNPLRTFWPDRTWWAHRSNIAKLNAYICTVITARWDARKQAGAGGEPAEGARRRDILDRIVGAYAADAWGPSAVRQLRDEVKTFMLAGHETSAAMLTWALYELVRHPEAMRRVRAEADAVLGAANGRASAPLPPKLADLQGLEFSLMCLKEALRLYSVVPTVTRVVQKPCELCGEHVPAGTTLMLGLQAVHHRADLWPDPLEFKPERFETAPKPYTFVPFIDGPRNCLGQNLALLEGKVVLATLVQRFDVTFDPKCVLGVKHPTMVPVVPDGQCLMRFAPRF